MRRKKYHLDNISSIRERRRKAAQIIALLSKKLHDGWSPWANVADSRQFTPLEEVFRHYTRHLETYDRDKTRHSYNSRLNILKEYLGSLPNPPLYAYQFDSVVMTEFLDYLYLDRRVSARTRNNYRGWLSSLCSFLVSRKFMESNLAEAIPNIRKSPSKKEDVSPEMLTQMRRHLEKSDPWFLFACMFHYYTLIRPAELSNIRLIDISIKEQRVFVPAEVSKNRRDGYVALSDTLIKMMLDLGIFSNPSEYYLFGKNFKPAAKKGRPDIFNKRFAVMRRQLGWSSNVVFYSLKSAGIRDLANSAGIVVARDQARHTDVSTTNKYLIGRGMNVAEAPKHFKGGFGDIDDDE